MSLQVWLPLTKDLRQQGLSDTAITNHGATFDSNGKLGGCYSFDGTDDNLSYTPSVDGIETLSIAFWVCPTAATPAGSFFSLERNTYWQLTFYGDHVAIRDNSIGYSGTRKNFSTGTYIANTWTHVAVTYDKGTLKIYRDGSLLSTNSVGGTKLNTSINNARIGSAVQSGYYYSGKMNDVRIYDHCLSPMEIKQLSQGLVLHYPLNRGGFGQENLIANTDFNGVSKKYTVTSSTEGGFRYTPTETIVANTEYTVSCRLRGDANMNLYKLCTGGNEAVYFVNRDQLSTSEYRRFSITFTYPSNKTLDQIYICTRYGTANSQAGDWFEIEPCSLKLEKGSIATPWCPNSSDALATTMGLNSTIEYDCSGFCNNGTRIGTFDWTSDTPKYQVSTAFDGTNYISTTTPGADILTLSCWVKTSKNKSTSQIMVADSTSQLCISFYSGTIITFYASSGYSTGSKCTLGSAYKENDWNHLVVVKTGTGTRKVYCNGVEQTATSNDYWSSSSVGFTVARRETSTPHAFYGELCDVRAYATALSADDVKSLYQNCATIDPDGTIRGQIRS